MRKLAALIAFIAVVFALLAFNKKKVKKSQEAQVEISTTYGKIVVKLYNETPQHRDNFLKLVEGGFYDSLLFHRVISNFMIQGGDPESKNAPEGKMLGNGGPGYDIDAEFVDSLFHKKGALAAAREGDVVNPLKKSSGSQFYIVQGQVFDTAQLMKLQAARLQKLRPQEVKKCFDQPAYAKMKATYVQALQNGNQQKATEIMTIINPQVDSAMERYIYTPKQIEVYTTIGGTPHLDDNYTVFGEVVSGLAVIDSIAMVATDRNNRPMQDVVMEMKVIKKPKS